ncbi:MAG: glycosyltransferase [Acidobacteriota bacterium]|nr:glycosyltransferase [Acidobacteriota bacterium]
MKVLHVPYCFAPDSTGGTENYVEALARQQVANGKHAEIAAPDTADQCYDHRGLTVHRFAHATALPLAQIYGEGDPIAAASFARVLDRMRPDIVHLHAFTSSISILLIDEAKARGAKVVFTYHTPTVSCQRGTLLENGRSVCDGILDVSRCAKCALDGYGLGAIASKVLGSAPPSLGKQLLATGVTGRIAIAFGMTYLMRVRQIAFRQLINQADHIVAVCEWVRDLLTLNGADSAKMTLSRQGVTEPSTKQTPERGKRSKPIRLVFLGRASEEKGAHRIIEALRSCPELCVSLDLFLVIQGQAGRDYARVLEKVAAGDGRIQFRAPMPAGKTINTLMQYDAMVVPSQWLETGPLVVYEAFAAGIPVLGSRLGGITELVKHGITGLLLDPLSTADWCGALRLLSTDDTVLDALSKELPEPRRMPAAAADMDLVYARVLGNDCQAYATYV